MSADKNELDLTTLKKQSYVFLGMTRHVIGTEMSFADFSRIAKSENVEIRVGPNTFRFIEGHKQAMRDILSTIESK